MSQKEKEAVKVGFGLREITDGADRGDTGTPKEVSAAAPPGAFQVM